MQNAALMLGLVLLVAAIGVAVTALVAGRKAARLWARAGQGPSPRDQVDKLPPVVRDFALRSGGQVAAGQRALVLTQSADLRLKRGGLFQRYQARQIVALGEASFVWQARRRFGPFSWLQVTDALVAGEGRLEARLFGAMPVARAFGVEVTLAEAFRYLAELPWAPDAILGNPDVEWRMIAPDAAEARINTRVGTARVIFGFDAAGDIVTMQARQRPATDPSGRPVRYDWRGQFGDYRQVGQRRLPTYGEVGYVYPEGYEVYFRGRITDCRTADG